MKIKNISKHFFTFSLIKLFFLFKIINLISSKLDNIIQIGTENYRYVRFSLSSKGDMIVDSSTDIRYGNVNENEYQNKVFFGLKRNGRFYFKDENSKETPFITLTSSSSQANNYPESCFIQLSTNDDNNGKEYFFNIGNNKVEISDFEKGEVSSLVITGYYNLKKINSLVSSLFKSSYSSDSKYYYIFANSVVGQELYLVRDYFDSSQISTVRLEESYILSKSFCRIVTCFETDDFIIICLYLNKNHYLEIYGYAQITLKGAVQTLLYNANTIEEDADIFFKGIHFKKEIGIFMYYTSTSSTNPIISFKYIDKVKAEMVNYNNLGNIILNKYELNPGTLLNDILKINDSKICICSTSSNKEILYLLILNLFDDDTKVMINYYAIEIYKLYSHKIYYDIRLFLYNDYITFGFSHCSRDRCTRINEYEESSDLHYSSFIVFNYPNGTDFNLDLLDYLSNDKKDTNNFTINLSNNIIIENNIFGYQIIGIKILDIAGDIDLKYSKNKTIISKNDIILKDDDIQIFIPEQNYESKNSKIEYAGIVKGSDYNNFFEYINKSQYINMAGFSEEYYSQKEFIGKSLYYNILIKKDLTHDCNMEKCSLCPSDRPEVCISCNDGYYLNSVLNQCVLKPGEESVPDIIVKTTQLTTIPTTQIITTIPTTQILTTIPTTQITTIPTTQIITTIPTTQITTIPTTQITTISTTQILTTIPTTQILTTIPTTQITTIPTTQILTTIPTTQILTTIPTTQIITTIPINKITTISKTTTIQKTEVNSIHKITTIPKTSFKTIMTTNLKTTGLISLFSENIDSSKLSIIPSNLASITVIPKMQKSILYSEELSSSTIKNITSKIKCSNEKILENKCTEKITPEQTQDIYNTLKDDIKKGEFNKTNNTIIQTGNVIFQISTLKEQENNDNLNISIIDFSECEKIIKEKYGIKEEDELIMLKSDISNEDSKIYVQYEIYNPYTLDFIPLDICNEVKININIPITLNQTTESLLKSLNNSGYNLFNINDSFYHDICSRYTTENGTDIILMDRLNIFYDTTRNTYLCQDGCEFIFYNETSKRSKCNCNIQKKPIITNIRDIIFDKKQLVNNLLLRSLKNSNFKVMKCYKLIFSLDGQIGNIGSYILASITFIIIILMICYYIKGNKQLYEFIQIVIRQKFLNSKNNQRIKNRNLKGKKKDIKINKEDTNKTKNNKNDKKNKKNKKNKSIKKKDSKNEKKKEKKEKSENKNKIKNDKNKKKKGNYPPKKEIKKNSNSSTIMNNSNNDSFKIILKKNMINRALNSKNKTVLIKEKNNIFKDKNNKIKRKNGKDKSINIINYVNKINIINNPKKEKILMEKKDNLDKNKILGLNDEELNSLSYKEALIIDKRTYFQYYCSLLRKKHIILFTFYPNNDYNLFSVKISLFLISFSLYMTINGFFFTDNTMHKIMIDNGEFDFIFQIPQILYSTAISAICNMMLKRLSLSEMNILSLKQEKSIKIAQFESKKVLSCLKIKFIIFYILCILFMLFFWYFISGFCAVYKNTQIILIGNTLISFLISMISPFGINLLPGIFRISALRAKKKNKSCLYKTSGLVALI